jgi:folate-binding protein YgfZ
MPQHTPFHEAAVSYEAVFTEEAGWLVPAHYRGGVLREYRRARERAARFDASHRGKVELVGSEAGRFLQGLCSNDVLRLKPGTGCEAFLLNVKARVVAHLFVYCTGASADAFELDMEPGLAEKVCQHLNHYLISEQVTISDRTADLAQVHLAGPKAPALVARLFGSEWGDEQYQHRTAGAWGTIRRHDRLGMPGYDFLFPRIAPQMLDTWGAMSQLAIPLAGRDAYEALRIEAGTPAYGRDIDETHLGPEVGRTAQAISYTKGCYLGQEPVCRIRDLGQVNRTLLGVKIQGQTPVPHGAKLLRDGAEVGQVMSSAFSPGLGLVVALAYVRRGSQQPGTAVEVEAGDERRPAELASLPFGGSAACP